MVKDKQFKKQLIEEGLEQVKLALVKGNHISSIHKWYGVLLNERCQYISTDEQIRSAYEVLDHFEEVVRLNPQDPTGYYILGSWSVAPSLIETIVLFFGIQVLGSGANLRLETQHGQVSLR